MRIPLRSALFLIAAYAISTGARAHFGTEIHVHAGFESGFVHPLSGLDHLAAMLAVGAWSAQAARRAGADLLWAPLSFAGMLLVGALLGLQGLMVPGVEPMVAASLLVTGLLLCSRVRVPGPLAAALIGAFAIFHGLAHGYELAGSNGAAPALAGMLCATVLLHATGVAIGWALRAHIWVPRIAGGSVAVLGVGLLSQLA